MVHEWTRSSEDCSELRWAGTASPESRAGLGEALLGGWCSSIYTYYGAPCGPFPRARWWGMPGKGAGVDSAGRAGKGRADVMSMVRHSRSSANVWWERLHLLFRCAPWRFPWDILNNHHVQPRLVGSGFLSPKHYAFGRRVPQQDELSDGSLNTHTVPELVVTCNLLCF